MHKTRASRAQIFQSFDALKGFREILKEKEIVIVPKKILSEDDLAEVDYKVHQIKVGMIVKVTYYDNGQYVQIEEKVSKLNLDTKMIQIVKTKLDLKHVVDESEYKLCKLRTGSSTFTVFFFYIYDMIGGKVRKDGNGKN